MLEILDRERRKEWFEKIKIRSTCIEVAQSKKCFEGLKCLKVKFLVLNCVGCWSCFMEVKIIVWKGRDVYWERL